MCQNCIFMSSVGWLLIMLWVLPCLEFPFSCNLRVSIYLSPIQSSARSVPGARKKNKQPNCFITSSSWLPFNFFSQNNFSLSDPGIVLRLESSRIDTTGACTKQRLMATARRQTGTTGVRPSAAAAAAAAAAAPTSLSLQPLHPANLNSGEILPWICFSLSLSFFSIAKRNLTTGRRADGRTKSCLFVSAGA